MGSSREMHSLHLVDPELRELLQSLPDLDLRSDNLVALRSSVNEMMDVVNQAFDRENPEAAQSCEQILIPRNNGEPAVRALLYKPLAPQEKRPGYFHIHGGGYVIGKPETRHIRDIATMNAHDCVVLTPAYRLAPETKFPGAIEDLYAALKWFHDEADTLGVDRDRIIVAGESAGGGLAACLMLMVRDRGEFSVAGQILVYPMLDDRTGGAVQPQKYAGEFVWTSEMNQFGWSCMLPCEPGSEGISEYAAAARAVDLAGLPPAFIFTGALDLYIDENLHHAKRLIHAGVPTSLHVYPGAYHSFDIFLETTVGKQFQHDINFATRRLFQQDLLR